MREKLSTDRWKQGGVTQNVATVNAIAAQKSWVSWLEYLILDAGGRPFVFRPSRKSCLQDVRSTGAIAEEGVGSRSEISQ